MDVSSRRAFVEELHADPHACVCVLQNKYKQKGRLEISSSVFHHMPETKEMEFVKQISELQSEVRRSDFAACLLAHFTLCFMSRCWFVSQTKYKKDKEDLSITLHSLLPETLHTQFVKEMADTHSEVTTHRSPRRVFIDLQASIQTHDIRRALMLEEEGLRKSGCD